MPVEIIRRNAGRKYQSNRLKSVANAILAVVGQSQAELSIALIGNAEMRRLNRKYRGRDYPTDVLSFPVQGDLPPELRILGDVVISLDKAKEQAGERGRTLDEEMVTLLIHGIVHLMGYDHERSPKDARIMTRLEKKIFRALCDQGTIEL